MKHTGNVRVSVIAVCVPVYIVFECYCIRKCTITAADTNGQVTISKWSQNRAFRRPYSGFTSTLYLGFECNAAEFVVP